MAERKTFNPFYFLLVVTGVVFCLTACTYGVLTVRGLHPEAPESEFGLLAWMDHYGSGLMLVELAALAVFTFAAMGTDSFWERTRTPNGSDNEGTQ